MEPHILVCLMFGQYVQEKAGELKTAGANPLDAVTQAVAEVLSGQAQRVTIPRKGTRGTRGTLNPRLSFGWVLRIRMRVTFTWRKTSRNMMSAALATSSIGRASAMKMTITADHGRLERTGDRVWIEGHVVLVREGDAKVEPLRVTTDRLLVLPDEGIARTRSEVTMVSPSGRVVATGLEVDNKTRTMTLERVHATYKSATR